MITMIFLIFPTSFFVFDESSYKLILCWIVFSVTETGISPPKFARCHWIRFLNISAAIFISGP